MYSATGTLVFDEVDAYSPSAGTDGDQIKLGIRRTEYYWDRKIIAGSTPLVAGASRITEMFEAGDQRGGLAQQFVALLLRRLARRPDPRRVGDDGVLGKRHAPSPPTRADIAPRRRRVEVSVILAFPAVGLVIAGCPAAFRFARTGRHRPSPAPAQTLLSRG